MLVAAMFGLAEDRLRVMKLISQRFNCIEFKIPVKDLEMANDFKYWHCILGLLQNNL